MTATGQPTLVIIGGLLGAGKTTLAIEAARRLTDAGRRVGIVTNDQGSGLVDTALARVAHVPVREVAGGCFCCRLSDLLRAADSLARLAPEVIFAEPVGSCLDLAATVLRPILRDEAARFRVAPLTVLVDPARAHQLVDTPDSDLAYLFRHQLEEADIVCYSKTDNGVAPPVVEGVAGHFVSARTGAGVGEWLGLVLGHERPSGQCLISVDYQRYSDAEAALAWLNWQVRIELRRPAVARGRRRGAQRAPRARDYARRHGDRAREGARSGAHGVRAGQRLRVRRRARRGRRARRVALCEARSDYQCARPRRSSAVVACCGGLPPDA